MIYGGEMLAFVIGPWEIGVIALVGLLIFGNRLPEVGKSLGRGVVEFKKGIRGIEDDINEANDNNQDNDRKHLTS